MLLWYIILVQGSMNNISIDDLRLYQNNTFRIAPDSRVKNFEEAIEFVNQRGFIFFWPIKGIAYPSLWTAVVGDRPVPNDHDDPGHITWDWKDSSLGKDVWHYAKLLRKKATFVSLKLMPFFYALSNNFGSPDEDHLILYSEGRLTLEAKEVYDALLREGPLDSISLRQAAHLTHRDRDSSFNRALDELQADLKIMPIGISNAGPWHYAFIYDIVARHYPDIISQSHNIQSSQARQKIIETYFLSMGFGKLTDITKIFSWSFADTQRAVNSLIDRHILANIQIDNYPGEWIALASLIEK